MILWCLGTPSGSSAGPDRSQLEEGDQADVCPQEEKGGEEQAR